MVVDPEIDEETSAPRAFADREADDHVARLRDPVRLASLRDTRLLDSPQEERFDRAVRLVRLVTGASTALFSLVDDRRQFFKAQAGFQPRSGPVRQTPLSHSFCQHVVSQAEPLGVSDARDHPLLAANGAVRDLDVVAYLGVPVRGRRGQVIGSLCAIEGSPRAWSARDVEALGQIAAFLETEIALRKQLSERQLLVDELNHRVGNIFAIVNGLVRLGRHDGASVPEFAAALQARIGTLALSHQLATPLVAGDIGSQSDITLADLVSEFFKPFSDAGGLAIDRDGPTIRVGADASTYLALAINELVTNAVKYGALSVTDGELSVRWRVEDDTVHIDWNEHCPAGGIAFGAHDGFGSRLIELCIAARLEGRIETRATDHGLSRAISIPVRALAS